MRNAISQAQLILKKRLNEFEGLIDDCEFGTSVKIVTYEDLQEFWDMLSFQVYYLLCYLFINTLLCLHVLQF